MIELAKRAVACKHWRWLPGMRTLEHGRVIEGNGIAVIDRDGSHAAGLSYGCLYVGCVRPQDWTLGGA